MKVTTVIRGLQLSLEEIQWNKWMFTWFGPESDWSYSFAQISVFLFLVVRLFFFLYPLTHSMLPDLTLLMEIVSYKYISEIYHLPKARLSHCVWFSTKVSWRCFIDSTRGKKAGLTSALPWATLFFILNHPFVTHSTNIYRTSQCQTLLGTVTLWWIK